MLLSYICVKNIATFYVEFTKKNSSFLSFHSSVFHSKIHKHPAFKMNRDKQGGEDQKFEVLSEYTFWMTPKFFSWKKRHFRTFSQLIHRFNIWILKCWSGAVYISKFFPIHKRDGKLRFLKSLDCISKFSPIHWKVWKLRFCPLAFIFGQMVRVEPIYD